MANIRIEIDERKREADVHRRMTKGHNSRCPTCDAAPHSPCVTKSGAALPGWRLWSNDHSSYERMPGWHTRRWFL